MKKETLVQLTPKTKMKVFLGYIVLEIETALGLMKEESEAKQFLDSLQANIYKQIDDVKNW